MKIILINPPFLPKYSRSSRSPAVTKSGTIYFPIWLSYATGVLEKAGHQVSLIDAPAQCLSTDEAVRRCQEYEAGLIICDTSTPSIITDLSFCDAVKKALPHCKICLVGTHASVFATEILQQNLSVDFVARHEYDYTVRELAEKLSENNGYRNIMGITFRENGEIVANPDRPFIENLDELPFVSEVYKKHLDIKNYFYAHVSFPTISIFSSRGCPAKCFYCMYSQVMFGKFYRKRSPESLYAECEYMAANFPEVREILIDDDNFAVDKGNVREFCELMIKSKNRLKWIVQVRVDLDIETMKLMKKAGCKLLVAGFESGNQKVLDNMNKGITLEQSQAFDRNAKKAGLRVHGCFMVGNPGETSGTMLETLQFALKLHLDTAQFFPLIVYPGTKAYEWAKENAYVRSDNFREWLTEEGLHNCVLQTSALSSEDLVSFCDFARKRFYLRPKYILKKAVQSMLSMEDFVKTFKAFNTFRTYLFKRG